MAKGCKRNFKCMEENCSLGHHQLRHEAHASGVVFHSTVVSNSLWKSADTLFQLQQIRVGKRPSQEESLNVLWDGGSTLSFITFQEAKKLQLQEQKIRLQIVKVGGEMKEFD